ncbi:hypothetical protein ACWDR3_06695 [Streptomyces sp. NPDC001002]
MQRIDGRWVGGSVVRKPRLRTAVGLCTDACAVLGLVRIALRVLLFDWELRRWAHRHHRQSW